MSDRKTLYVFIAAGLVLLAAVVVVAFVYVRPDLPFKVDFQNGTWTVYFVVP